MSPSDELNNTLNPILDAISSLERVQWRGQMHLKFPNVAFEKSSSRDIEWRK